MPMKSRWDHPSEAVPTNFEVRSVVYMRVFLFRVFVFARASVFVVQVFCVLVL